MNSRGIDPDKEAVIDIPLEEISNFPDHSTLYSAHRTDTENT